MTGQKPQLVVIGGGAAGFFAAIQARCLNPNLETTILEAAPKPLGKVKISGGGRCNVTHACLDVNQLVQHYPRGQRELKSVFSRFGPADTVHWFESHGVRLKTEADGRMFPVTDDSQTVIDCLLRAAREAGVTLHTKTPVRDIEKSGECFILKTPHRTWEADAVLLASGSAREGYRWAESLGHTVIPPVPSLFTFNIQDPLLERLAGISFPHVKAKVETPGEKPITQEGPLLITHWGLSGPVVLRLSAWGARLLYAAHYQGTLTIDFCPALNQEALQNLLITHKQQGSRKQIGNDPPFDIPKRFWQRFLQLQGVSPETPWNEIPQKSLNRLSETLKRYSLPIQGKGVFKEEFVTAGGIPLKEINLKTMESRCTPGLYFAGEIIDVDGLTGGFNFQNAWSTGWLAGGSAAQTLLQSLPR